MRFKAKFTDSTEQFKPNFGEIIEIKDGYTQAEFDKAVADAYANGSVAGYEDGHAKGYGQGYAEGNDAGQTAEYDRFWNAFQAYDEASGKATKTGYSNCFANNHWNMESYNPKYDIECSGDSGNATNIFYGATRITDTKKPIRVNGIVLTGAFTRCSALETIPLLELNGVTGFSQTFTGCSKLREITIAGSIDVSFNISATAVLSVASAKSIIEHLTNYAGTDNEYTNTLKLNDAVWAALEAEGNTAPHGGTWEDYVTELCWNT